MTYKLGFVVLTPGTIVSIRHVVSRENTAYIFMVEDMLSKQERCVIESLNT
jgi:hypothetical protein